jgi:hypothetical protein
MRDRNVGAGELLLLGLAGVSAGLAAGFALASWTGRVSGARVKSAARRLGAPLAPAAVAPRKAVAALARDAHAGLAADLQLAALGLVCRPVGRAGLELHGWVPSRALRARAARLVQDVAGVDSVVNCLLVRGEDDREPILDEPTEPTTQTA